MFIFFLFKIYPVLVLAVIGRLLLLIVSRFTHGAAVDRILYIP